MAALLTEIQEIVSPTSADARLAQESSRSLSQLLASQHASSVRVRIETEDAAGKTLEIPVAAFRLLNDILSEMARGNAVRMIPIHAELTTRQAAEILNVSRPFLINQLEQGLIPFRKVGTHRRIMFQDLLGYQQKMNQDRRKTLEELSELDQDLGLGY